MDGVSNEEKDMNNNITSVFTAFRILASFIREIRLQYGEVPSFIKDGLELSPNFSEEAFEALPENVRNAHDVWANAVWRRRHHETQGHQSMVPQGGSVEEFYFSKPYGDYIKCVVARKLVEGIEGVKGDFLGVQRNQALQWMMPSYLLGNKREFLRMLRRLRELRDFSAFWEEEYRNSLR